MSVMTAVAGGLSVLSTVMANRGVAQEAEARTQAYASQARQAKFQGKQAELKYRQDGLQVLRAISQNMASVNARAAAGSIDPWSGSALSLKNYAEKAGTEEFYLTRENAALQTLFADMNVEQYNMASQQAVRQAKTQMMGNLVQTAANVAMIGGTFGWGGGGAAAATSPMARSSILTPTATFGVA